MTKYILLFNYIKQKNQELDIIYDISELDSKLKNYQEKYEVSILLPTNIFSPWQLFFLFSKFYSK